MKVKHFVWAGERAPVEDLLRLTLENNGWAVHPWHDPCDRTYDPHSHRQDESLWIVEGELDVVVDEHVYHLLPGDRLLLPAETVRSARVGPAGAMYLIGRRWASD